MMVALGLLAAALVLTALGWPPGVPVAEGQNSRPNANLLSAEWVPTSEPEGRVRLQWDIDADVYDIQVWEGQ